MASTYDFAVNIVMLINITITINKTNNIHDLIYAASAYDSVNIIMVIKHVTWIIHVTKKILIFYGQEYVLIDLKSIK